MRPREVSTGACFSINSAARWKALAKGWLRSRPDVDVLDGHLLMTLAAMTIEGLQQHPFIPLVIMRNIQRYAFIQKLETSPEFPGKYLFRHKIRILVDNIAPELHGAEGDDGAELAHELPGADRLAPVEEDGGDRVAQEVAELLGDDLGRRLRHRVVHEDDAHRGLAEAGRLDRRGARLGVLVDVLVQLFQILEGLVPVTGRGVVPGQELAGTVGIGAVDLLQSRRDVAVQIYTAFAPMVHIGALERVAGAQHDILLEVPPDELEADRGTLRGDAARDCGRAACHRRG